MDRRKFLGAVIAAGVAPAVARAVEAVQVSGQLERETDFTYFRDHAGSALVIIGSDNSCVGRALVKPDYSFYHILEHKDGVLTLDDGTKWRPTAGDQCVII